MDPPQTSSAGNDIFSLSDQTLAERLQFIEEIGYGNWGSVWRCCPKPDPSSKSPPNKYEKVKLAVKLVHRSKTQTTAARVRSLWNEMKVVRSLKKETHTSIIPFYSFIITPSYALITMAYLPRLIPVEVDEFIARAWFKLLLSGIEFLHIRGVVHNDIKPANILLSDKDVPVLVDFGFAEKYELGCSKAFRSNLAYGTPEYLSPERARGRPHDTRKSDVWSLGITFFEILIGRTPFEYVEGEQFSTKKDLEKYWARTVRGKWVGSYKMSRGIEKLIRRMVSPNVDVRCLATEALDDPYWIPKEALKSIQKTAHRKSASLSQAALSAMSIDVDASRFLDILSPFTTRTLKDRKSNNKENLTKTVSSTSVRKSNIKSDFVVDSSEILKKVRISAAERSSNLPPATPSSKSKHIRSQSQPKVAVNSVQNTPESSTTSGASKPVVKTPVFVPLEPIKGSTTPARVVNKSTITPSRAVLSPVKVRSTSGKENAGLKEPRVPKPKTPNENSTARIPSEGRLKKPVGPRKPPPTLTPEKKRRVAGTENAVSPKKPPTTRGAGRVLGDLSNTKVNPKVLGGKSRNSNTQSTFTSPDQITSFFTSPGATELSMNLNIHGDSYTRESVWLNRTTETTGKSQNENSFASLGKGSVKERWMDWERERERLREMDKDKIKETDDEDTNRRRRSIMTVMSEPEPDVADAPFETDMDVTLEFAPGFRTSEERSRRSIMVERKEENATDTKSKASDKEGEAENIFGRRRGSQGSRIFSRACETIGGGGG